jgi:hypothetical protein
MPTWKKAIFVRAIKSRMEAEIITAEYIILEYVKLTDSEKIEILAEINKVH